MQYVAPAQDKDEILNAAESTFIISALLTLASTIILLTSSF